MSSLVASYLLLSLCLVFGLINFAIGGVLIYNYYGVQNQITSSELAVEQGAAALNSGLTNASSFLTSYSNSSPFNSLPLANINSSLSKLHDSVGSLISSINIQIENINGNIELAMIGAAGYFMLQGLVFIIIGFVVLHISKVEEWEQEQEGMEDSNDVEDEGSAPKSRALTSKRGKQS